MSLIVLMSTYNGEKYLREQLDSIVHQELCPDRLLIRDDGSFDSTLNILKEYKEKYSFIDYYQGSNKKPAKSFWELIEKAGDFDYYSLCDQDDVWFKDKLKVAVETLKKEDNSMPLLYCSRFTMTDEYLNDIHAKISKLYSYTDFAHALLYQTAPGCTFVFNKAAREKLIKYEIDKNYCIIHDSIIHKVVTMFGKMILDESSHMYYRQHGDNQIGLPINQFEQFILRIQHFLRKTNANYRSNMAKSLLSVYKNDISAEKRNLLEIVAFYKENRNFRRDLLNKECFKVHSINDIFFQLLVLFGNI